MTGYCFLVHPSANRVYAKDAPRLAVAEVRALAASTGVPVEDVREEVIGGVPYVVFDAPPLDEAGLAVVSNLSALYALYERDGDTLRPVAIRRLSRWDEDLLSIQRYPGKTNEQLTRLLVNVAVSAASGATAFTGAAKQRVLDPLCGRGATLNQAVVYGYDAFGIDIDRRDVEAYTAFFLQWLKDKRAKHTSRREGQQLTVEFAPSKEAQKAGGGQQVVIAVGETTAAREVCRNADVVVADLPYGVQHGSTAGGALSRSPRDLLAEAAPAWVRALRPGGAMALAWNVNVLSRAEAASLLDAAGAVVVEDPLVDFQHRVDRAVVRDVLVARKGGAGAAAT